jgi:hypothetical protein
VTPAGLAHRSAVSRPERHRTRARRTIRTGKLDVSAPSHVGVDGQAAGPYDAHGRYTALDPSRLQRPNCAGGVPRVKGQLILARSSARRPMQASSKSTAESRVRMLRKSGRQHCGTPPVHRDPKVRLSRSWRHRASPSSCMSSNSGAVTSHVPGVATDT